ncbi:hypothetical protein GGI25_000713 [Coemansia spiralis]|uniref:Uncharacterized protein n=2 Tax=Coemansia TaxID=4863 RepID=A0A9W8GDQ4_9FUNG|nr:hypothetical protein EDC05_000670 [Coemansia umbellata]KAJ2623660.1 hypothetical protein GGI26_002107 [Coemansia sp. RSA 1358]KAJ2680421.1 hypothetical protein GGI25_000713 [Coemansia spiralis]
MVASVGESKSAQSPFGGRYVALLRRTNTGMLFSDPVFIADGQPLPELPEGLEYVVVHPSATPAKDHKMEEFMPTNALQSNSTILSQPSEQSNRNTVLPLEEDYGMFSSFLPMKDSSLSTLSHADITVLNSGHSLLDEKELASHVSEAELASAIELADKILGSYSDSQLTTASTSSVHDAISQEVLENIGFPLVTQPNKQPLTRLGTNGCDGETAESILNENNILLAQLVEMQDKRALKDKFGEVSNEEMAIATKLQASFARIIASSKPAALRPPSTEIKRAANMLLAKSHGIYSGVLPPQQRFAFVSNAVSSTDFPQGATTTPMQRISSVQK